MTAVDGLFEETELTKDDEWSRAVGRGKRVKPVCTIKWGIFAYLNLENGSNAKILDGVPTR